MWLEPKSVLVPGFVDTDTYVCQGNWSGSGSGAFHPQREFFSHWEILESTNGGRNRVEHNCSHYKRTTTLPKSYWSFTTCYGGYYDVNNLDKWARWTTRSRSYFWESIGGPNDSGEAVYGPWDLPLNGLPMLYEFNDVTKKVEILTPSELAPYVESALQALLPGIRPRLSLLNSIYELKDFKSLPRTLAKIKDLGSTLLKGRIWGQRTLRRLLHSSADGYLQSEFNLKPLLSDIAGLRSAIAGVRDEVQKLLENEGKVRRLHRRSTIYRWPVSDSEHATHTAPVYYGEPYGVTFRRVVGPSPISFVATIQYQYALEPWEREQALLRGFLDAVGVNLNPAIIWNAIPWSFVVDWVINIGQWLDQFKTRNIEPKTRIHSYVVSQKFRRTIDTEYKLDATHQPSPDPSPVQMVNIVEEAYIRSNCNAHLIRWFTTSGLNLHEFSLAAALLAGRV